MRILRWCLSASFFKVGCKLVSFSRMTFYRSRSCQGDGGILYACAVLVRNLAQERYVVGNPRNKLASLLPKFPERTLHLIRKISPSLFMKYNRGPSSLWILIRPYLMVKSHSLMLVSWLKAIRTVTFYAMQFWAWSPQPSKMIDFQQEHTPWSRICLACSGYIAWNQIVLGIHAGFHQLCNQFLTYSFFHML